MKAEFKMRLTTKKGKKKGTLIYRGSKFYWKSRNKQIPLPLSDVKLANLLDTFFGLDKYTTKFGKEIISVATIGPKDHKAVINKDREAEENIKFYSGVLNRRKYQNENRN
jgi:hypothetical protein